MKALFGRRWLYWGLSLFYSLLVVGAAVGVNVLALRVPLAIDLGGGLGRALRPETARVLGGLSVDVEVLAFLPEGEEAARVRAMFSEWEAASPRLRARVVDPEAEPGLARSADMKEGEKVLLRTAGRESRLATAEEIPMVQALARLTAARQRDVCLVLGHEERSMFDEEPGGISRAARLLVEQGFAVRATPLGSRTLDGCRVVVVAGPGRPIPVLEREALIAHVARGGGLFLLVESEFPGGLLSLLGALGLDLAPGSLESSEARDPRAVGGRAPGDHPATAALLASGRRVVLFAPGALYLRASVPGEVLLLSSGDVAAPGFETEGPYPLAFALTHGAGRVVAVSDAEFISNARIDLQGNRDLWLGAIDWLAEEEVASPSGGATLSDEHRRSIALLVEGLFPALFAFVGLYAWRKRRGR